MIWCPYNDIVFFLVRPNNNDQTNLSNINDEVDLILSSAGAQQHHQTLNENGMIFY